MKTMILFFLLIATSSLIAQKETNNWYFKYKCGLTFNKSDTCPNPPCPMYNGMITADEGFATISDSSGELLFYAEGERVWNKKHEIMENGDSLFGHFSSSQSVLIVPFPDKPNLFYLFTVDGMSFGDSYCGDKGFNYNIIDISQNNGLGKVILKNQNLLKSCTEKLSAVINNSCDGYWVVIHEWESNAFYSYLINDNGISEPVISKVGTIHSNNNSSTDCSNKIGKMKFSTYGNFIAVAVYEDGFIELCNFNKNTGLISNCKRLKENYFGFIYDLEFSNNEKFLYFVNKAGYKPKLEFGIYQYDISLSSINEIYNSSYKILDLGSSREAFLQMGIDGRIYIGYLKESIISTIENPDYKCPSCRFKASAIELTNDLFFGLFPNFIGSYFYRNKISVSDYKEKIGNELKIPINLNINCSYIQKNMDFYYSLEIQFDASYFYPYDNPLIKNNIVKDGQRILTLEGIFKPDSQESIITEIEGLVLLGNGTKTPIKITKFEILNTEMEVETQDGSLEIYGVCAPEISHIILIDPLEVRASPNPVTDNLKFELRYNTPMDISIILYNSLSQAVLKSEIGKDKVQNDLELDVSHLPNGIYFATIKSGTEIITKQFVIMR
jgi:hypothetical protein